MGCSLRMFIVEDDDSLRRLSMARYGRLRNGGSEDRMPEYAGRSMRLATVVVNTFARVPISVWSETYEHLPFNSYGGFDTAAMEESACEFMRTHSIVDAMFDVDGWDTDFKKMIYDQNHRWNPGPDLAEKIRRAALEGVTKGR